MDFAILNAIQEYCRTPLLDTVMLFITHLGDLAIIWFIAAAVLIALPKQRRYGVAVLLAIILAAAVGSLVLKPLFGRARPYEVVGFAGLLIAPPAGSSFPSNHSMVSFAAATALCCLPGKGRGITVAKVTGVIVACLIAFSRLYLYVHFPSDVAVGAILGVGIGLLSVALVKRLPPAVPPGGAV